MGGDDEKEEETLQAAPRPQPSNPPPDDLERLFREHSAGVYRAAYRVTGNADDAEDVLQTVFLRLLRREEALDASRGVAGYLHRAAVNAAVDLLRSRRRNQQVALDDVEGHLADVTTPGPEGMSVGHELGRLLRRALARLSPRSAEIFALRYFEGYGNREIAAMIGASQTAVAVLLHRTRGRLEKQLRPLLGEMS